MPRPTETDVFIVGAPRSGTTWVQAVLSQHPSFASPPETYLFDVLRTVQRRHEEGLSVAGTGIRSVVSPDQLNRWMSSLWTDVRQSLLDSRPGATRVLEKSPDHALAMDLIRAVVPGARFIHVVRHPRAVVRSMLEASDGWGKHWAPKRVEEAAARWHNCVAAATRASSPTDTVVVRHEDLVTGPQAWLPLLAHAGIENGWPLPILDISPLKALNVTVPSAIDGDPLTNMRNAINGFSFHDRTPDQRRNLTRFESRYVEATCNELMRRHGYSTTDSVTRLNFIDNATLQARRLRYLAQRIFS